MALVNFYRGLKEKYNQETHSDGLFFSTDTQEIILNGKSYGGEGIADVDFAEGKLTFTFLNSSTLVVPITEATSTDSGLMSASDKASLDIILGEGAGSITDLLTQIQKAQSDVDNIGNVIIPEMNENTAKALDGKVDWDETKTVITLPINGSIAATQNSETGEGGVLICQSDYGEGNVTEVGNVRNKLTFNATERPQIDLAGGSQEKIAYESDLIKYGMFYPGVKVDTQKLFALTKSSTEDNIKAALQLETASGSYTLPTESILNDCLGKGYQLLSNWMPVNVAWNGAAWVFYLVGQTYMNQPNAVATVSIKITDGVYSVFQAAKVIELASIDDLKLMPNVIRFPLRTLQDKVYTQEEILEWFGVTEVSELKQKIVSGGLHYLQYGISLSGNPHYYKMPVEYIAYESNNQIKLVFNGLNTRDDVPSKYEIIINTDGTIIEGNSNVKLTITPLSTQPEEIQDQIQSNIVQELGQDTTKVMSQKVVTDNVNEINADLNSLNTKVGNQKTEEQEATGIYKIIEDNKASADAAISEMIPLSQKGAASGVATLDENGKVPVEQLNGALAKVFGIEKAVANQAALPEDATEGQRYYTIDTKKIYERLTDSWDEGITPKEDTIYNFRKSDAIGSEDRTNILYRWDGADLVEISSSLALGETSGTAYAGDKGKALADKIAKAYGASSVINGLSDITIDSDDTKGQFLSAPNAVVTWNGSKEQNDIKIPYATSQKAGVMSKDDKAKLDQLTAGIEEGTPSIKDISDRVEAIETAVGDSGTLETESKEVVGAINELKGLVDQNTTNHTELEARVQANEQNIATIQGEEGVDGSIKKALKDAKDYADSKLTWTVIE